MRNKKHIKSFNQLTENLNTTIKNGNVYIPLGRGISGNWDDGYEFEGTLEDLYEFISNIINVLDDDQRNYIISNLVMDFKENLKTFKNYESKSNLFDSSMNKLVNFIKRLGDFFSIMCPKCDEKGIRSRMEEKYYMPGMTDSIYWICNKCGHKEDIDFDI